MLTLSSETTASGTLISAIISDGTLKYLWGLVNMSQVMALVPLVDVPVPPNMESIFNLMAVANGDFAFLQHLPNIFRENQVFNLTAIEEQKPLNPSF